MQTQLLFILLVCVASYRIHYMHIMDDIQISGNIYADPQKLVPVYSDNCGNGLVNITINFTLAGRVDFYVYPGYMTNRCDILPMYYTLLALTNSTGYNGELSSDIQEGTMCIGFLNQYTSNSPIVTYNFSVDCTK